MIPEVNPYNNYRGDGVATLFDYDFFIQNGSQLIVEHIDENDVVTRLEENIDYEIVVIEEEFAGYIKFPIEDSKFGILQENETLSLQLTLPFEQISEYGQSSLLDLNSIEFSYDYLTRLCQILKRQMERAIKVNEGSEANPTELLESINNNAIVSTNAAALASQKADEAMESANVVSGKVEEINNIYAEAVEKIETDKTNAIEEIEQSSSDGVEELNKIKEETKAFKDELVESGMYKFNLFDTKISDHILEGNEAKGWALQGTWVSGALYPDFYQRCLDEKNEATRTTITQGSYSFTGYKHANGHIFFGYSSTSTASYDTVNNIYNTYGIADYYGIDEANERIFLPRNKYFQQLTDDVSKVNNIVEAGLPNHKHFIMNGDTSASALSSSTYLSRIGSQNNGYNAYALHGNSTTADRGLTSIPVSSTIYGNSETVQPPSSLKLLYYCVGNTVVNDSEINAAALIPQMELKANKTDVDGQWVKKDIAVGSSISIAAQQELTYDLSNYLPSDNNCYEIFLTCYATTGTTSGQFISIRIGSSIITRNFNFICAATTRSSSSVSTSGSCVLPIGSNKTISVYNQGNDGTINYLRVGAYRRLGANL